jgi:N-acetylated-alpha-linked acidic dipeptidase
MRTLVTYSLCIALASPALWPADPPPITGFTAASSRIERDWETRFRTLPDPAALRAYMQLLSAHPHHVGSAQDKANAEWIAAKAREWGLDASIESFDVLFPTPKERVLEMIEPTRFTAKIAEPPVAIDPTSGQTEEQLPVYNAYSIDGDVTAPLVYVNYGVPADYEELARLGVSVKGAIAIARYGGSWRGIKPKVAAEHGAIGCLIYSDPRDDGYGPGDTFPNGPFRPADGAQRGSVMDMPVYPGDPLTPGIGATKDAKRLPLSEVKTLTKIPVMPLSYADAQPLLAALAGRVVPEAWRGGLPITYHAGPGPAKVHLKLAFNWDVKPLYDVIVRIPGTTDPDQWVIRGNHHDAWVNGAEDPVSGLVPLLEELHAFSTLLKEGWKPKRTIVYCAWDGEEAGLLGSTEWAETHAAELRQKAVAYINSDSNSRGMLDVSGSHSLERFINGVARDIEDPETKLSAWKRLQASQVAHASDADDRKEARTRADLRIGALGSGSDYSVFLDHLGIASVNMDFSGEDHGGIYHSVYDDFYWYTHFSDTDFVYGRALAQTAGTSVMRLADSDLLPFEFSDLTDIIHRYIDEVRKLAKETREHAEEVNRKLDDGVFAATNDPRHSLVAPPKQTVLPVLDFAPLDKGFTALERSAKAYSEAAAHAAENGGAALASAGLREVNARLIGIERTLTLPDGLPNREWFKHQIYAPGFYTGYGVKTLPAIRESVEQKDGVLAQAQIARVGNVLASAAEAIQAAAADLARVGEPTHGR